MANNIQVGANSCVARANISFEAMGLTSVNTEIIYKIDGTVILSYKPGRTINPILGLEVENGYYFIAKADMDLTENLIPPIPVFDQPTNILLTGDAVPVNTGG